MKRFLKILGIGISVGVISVIGTVILIIGMEALFKLFNRHDNIGMGLVLFTVMSIFGCFIAYKEMV